MIVSLLQELERLKEENTILSKNAEELVLVRCLGDCYLLLMCINVTSPLGSSRKPLGKT